MRICPRCRSTYAEETDYCGIDGERLVVQQNDPLIGERIDRYEFVERLGGGAMGVVYRARHTELDRYFAIKVLYGEIGANKSLVGRFRREAQAVSKINHPNIIAVVDFGTTDQGLSFLVMENVEGETLADMLQREGSLPPERAAWIAAQVASGLGAAHRLGFVHRDVKPANIMIAGERSIEIVKVLDFGIVGIAEGHLSTKLTGTGRIVGTPRYMSPEQARGSGVGPAADLYSLGVMLYEMLAGQVPFPGDVMADVLVLHSTMPPPPLPPMRGLEELTLWLLAKRPEERPADAHVVIEEIRQNFAELPLQAIDRWGDTSNPKITFAPPWDEDQIPTTRPALADADNEVLEPPDLAHDSSAGFSSDLYDSGPDAHARPSAAFNTLAGGTDQIPAPVVSERSWWARRGPLLGLISLILSISALAVVVSLLQNDDWFDSDAEIQQKLARAEQRAKVAETRAKAALERAQRAEEAAQRLVEKPTEDARAPKKKKDALVLAERSLRRALKERGLTQADLSVLAETKDTSQRWLDQRTKDRERAAELATDLAERVKAASISNQLLWKKYERVAKALDALAKQKPKLVHPLEVRKVDLKKQLNQKRLPQSKREALASALTDLERDLAKALR